MRVSDVHGSGAIAWDVDVLFGTWARQGVRSSLDEVRGLLMSNGIRGALALSARGAVHDAVRGNRETVVQIGNDPSMIPVGTVDLRDALAGEQELHRLAGAGVRVVRLFPPEQQCEPNMPAFGYIAELAGDLGFLILSSGDVRTYGPVLRDSGVEVVFLDLHAYHVADFVLMAREELGFMGSTRLLNAPDSIERVVAEVGCTRLVYGSRIPLSAPQPSALRLRNARLSDEEWKAIVGSNIERFLKGSDA